MAAHAYALWTEPNETEQARSLGMFRLRSKALGRFVLWYRSLTTEERSAWDRFATTLDPTRPVTEQVEAGVELPGAEGAERKRALLAILVSAP